MKSYCENCDSLQLSSFRSARDAVTGALYEDLCCGTCHFIVATIQEREALAQPVQEPVAWVGLTDEERESIAQDYSLTGFGYQSPFKAIEDKLKEKNT
jgi:hypothetical protein